MRGAITAKFARMQSVLYSFILHTQTPLPPARLAFQNCMDIVEQDSTSNTIVIVYQTIPHRPLLYRRSASQATLIMVSICHCQCSVPRASAQANFQTQSSPCGSSRQHPLRSTGPYQGTAMHGRRSRVLERPRRQICACLDRTGYAGNVGSSTRMRCSGDGCCICVSKRKGCAAGEKSGEARIHFSGLFARACHAMVADAWGVFIFNCLTLTF
jgi:hypothetical protein